MKKTNEVKPFGMKDKLGYMLGDIGNDFPFQFTNMFLMIFYTKVLGINAAMVGTLFLVSRILDAFTDIGMGILVDKSKPGKDGKFIPWIRRFAGPFALSTFLMYQSSLASASMTIKVIYMFVTYILWGSVFYTITNIPYGSMASVITADPVERTSLSTFRNLGATVAGIVIGVIAPQVIYYQDAAGNQLINPTNFTMIAGVFSLLSFISYFACTKLCTERVKVQSENKEKVSIFKNLGVLAKNKALISVIVSSIVILLGGFVGQTLNQYLFIDYFRDSKALSAMSIITMPVGLIAAAISVKLVRKFGKKALSAASLLFTGALFILLYVMKVKNVWVYIGIYTVSQLGNMLFNMITYANITDVIDYNEILTGKRDDATIYALYSFARKLGQAFAGGIGGFALSAIGYNSSAAIQTATVTSGIYTMSTLLVGVFFIIAGLIFAFAYPLSKKVVEENTAKLAEKHKTN